MKYIVGEWKKSNDTDYKGNRKILYISRLLVKKTYLCNSIA